MEKSKTPHLSFFSKEDSVCLVPLSVALTHGISIDFFSSGYLDVSVHRVPAYKSKHLPKEIRSLIQEFVDQRSLASPYDLSQLATPFFST